MEFFEEFWKLVEEAKSVVVTSHKSFDDDSIGSVLAIYWLIKQKHQDKKIHIIYTGTADQRHASFEGYKDIEFVDDVAWYLKDCDLLIMLDGNQYGRFTANYDLIKDFKGKRICIDHHGSQPDKFELLLSQSEAAATCQIIYEQFCAGTLLSKPIAESLLLGILGDTGTFAYLGPKNLVVLDIAKQLLTQLNIDIQGFKSRYDLISPRTFELEKQYVANTKLEEIEGWEGFSWTYVDRDFLEKESYTDNEASGGAHVYMTSYMRLIKGAPWGFIILPKKDGSCSVSFRSLPSSTNVRLIVEGMKIGGGHDRAAGSNIKNASGEKVSPKYCYEKIVAWLKEHKTS